jgi:glycosyltransferase 2 family protein
VKLFVNLLLSFAVLALCLWLVWPNPDTRHELQKTLHELNFHSFGPYFFGYLGLLAATHFFRAWRWNNLLRPIDAELPAGRLLAISSVGFMAILALPARLGEFARPALLRKKGHVSATAVLGTVAVERIVDGLAVSLIVFGCCYALRGSPYAQSWMMPVAYTSLGIFLSAMLFLAFALRWPHRTVHLCVSMTFLPKLAPKLAQRVEDMLHKLISGFSVLKHHKEFAMFLVWSALYWGANAFGMWVLARGMHLDLPVIGAFAVMGLVAVGITLPNSPGLVAQFHWFTRLGLSLYMPLQVAKTQGMAYAIVLHGIQVVWYVAIGVISMISLHVGLHDFVGKEAMAEATGEEEAAA